MLPGAGCSLLQQFFIWCLLHARLWAWCWSNLVPAFQEQRQVRKQGAQRLPADSGQGGAARHMFEDGVNKWKAHTGVKDTD